MTYVYIVTWSPRLRCLTHLSGHTVPIVCVSGGDDASALLSSVQFSSVTQPCPTLATPQTAARPASLSITNSQSLLRLISIELVMPSSHLILCRPLLLLPSVFPSIRKDDAFQMSQLFTSGGQSIGVSATTSVLPMNIQDWFPLGWTCWISLQSKGLSKPIGNISLCVPPKCKDNTPGLF